MIGQLAHKHIRNRLKAVLGGGILMSLIFFGLLWWLNVSTSVDTLYGQLIVLSMGLCLTLGYLSAVPDRNEKRIPLFFFVLVNVLTSSLVWATGVLQSPFILLYAILIIVTAQLYNYQWALFQTLLSLSGFVFVYAAVITQTLPFIPILPRSSIDLLFQPTVAIMVYGGLYAALLFFTVYSSSSARSVYYRPYNKNDLDMTYQETIIQEMPVGVLVVDDALNIIGSNPATMIDFPFGETPADLTKFLSLPKVAPKKALDRLAKSGSEKRLTWKVDTGEVLPATIAVRRIKSSRKKHDTYIIFVE